MPREIPPRAAALLLLLPLAACEQAPTPAPGPTPVEAAARQLNVPTATLVELRAGVDALEARYRAAGGPGVATSPPDPASPQVRQLRAGLRALEQRYTASPPRLP